MKYNVISDGKVINTIIADTSFAAFYSAQTGHTLEPAPEPEPEPESDPITDLELALAELAEIVLGG